VTIAGQTFTVAQASASCGYGISPTSVSEGAAATAGTVSVTAGSGCGWTAVSREGWITVTSGARGSGSGTVGYSLTANTAAATRTGTVTIAGQPFTVNQAGGACSFTISPSGRSFAGAGGTGSVTVTTQTGCPWTAVSTVGWVTVTSGSGSGSGAFDYAVQGNTSVVARTGTITVAGQSFTVIEGGFGTPPPPKGVRIIRE